MLLSHILSQKKSSTHGGSLGSPGGVVLTGGRHHLGSATPAASGHATQRQAQSQGQGQGQGQGESGGGLDLATEKEAGLVYRIFCLLHTHSFLTAKDGCQPLAMTICYIHIFMADKVCASRLWVSVFQPGSLSPAVPLLCDFHRVCLRRRQATVIGWPRQHVAVHHAFSLWHEAYGGQPMAFNLWQPGFGVGS